MNTPPDAPRPDEAPSPGAPSAPAPPPASAAPGPEGVPFLSQPPPELAAQADAAALPSRPTLERLLDELLRQRRSERRWRVFFRLGWLGLALFVVVALFGNGLGGSAPSTPHTALIEVRGEIAADTPAGAEALVVALRQAFDDKGAMALVLRFNSPGGSPVQAGIVHDEILRLKALHGKKVYAVCEEVCASGAYYMAVAADAIYVDKASIVGSIGVAMDGFGFTGLMDKLGVERRLITAGDNKAMLDPFSPLNPRQRALAQQMIDQIHQQFIAVVRQGRGERLKDDGTVFSGLFWNGEQAVAMGLADQLGNLDRIAREVVKAEEVVDYTPRENVAERLAKRFGASIGAGAVRTLRELAPLR